jgi:hypothetical protein
MDGCPNNFVPSNHCPYSDNTLALFGPFLNGGWRIEFLDSFTCTDRSSGVYHRHHGAQSQHTRPAGAAPFAFQGCGGSAPSQSSGSILRRRRSALCHLQLPSSKTLSRNTTRARSLRKGVRASESPLEVSAHRVCGDAGACSSAPE